MSITRGPLTLPRVLTSTVVRDEISSVPPSLNSRETFMALLRIEQKRTERSGRYFILMLVDRDRLRKTLGLRNDLEKIVEALDIASRETDVKGWYREEEQIGVIFTEVPAGDAQNVVAVLTDRVLAALKETLGQRIDSSYLNFQIFPEDWFSRGSRVADPTNVERDLVRDHLGRGPQVAKRVLDIVGSLAAITVLSPVFLAAAVAVKLSSKGPIIFRQDRVGQHGRHFTFLKFRSMYAQNDPSIHREFVSQMIEAGKRKNAGEKRKEFKIQNDPRVTPLGRFLRKTSLDELPQFFNVLKGDMSLVGPRPPVPYEVDKYQIWHSQRLLSVKPGITGLWQVEGRSRVEFDDMVRMDLRYASTWSFWLDLKILLLTPKAVITGSGAV